MAIPGRATGPRKGLHLWWAGPLLLVLAACASGEGAQVASLTGSGAEPTQSAAAGVNDGGLAFAKCMRDHGVDFPDPNPEGGFGRGDGQRPDFDPNDEVVREAVSACRELRPNGGPRDRTFDAEAQKAAVGLAQCMREAGYDFPDPQFDANGKRIGGDERRRLNFGDPDFREVMAGCREASGLEFGPGRGAPPAPQEGDS